MLNRRPSNERGHFENEWLKSFHSFSFSDYHDPKHMHFHTLRVINHDYIAAGSGFPTHPHRDMEIMTYVLKGAVQHKDSLGNKEVIKAGEVQIMSAGTGILHSEENPSSTEELELMQIWIMPESRGLKPRYEQKLFSREDKLDKLKLLASKEAVDGSLRIFQDINIYGSVLQAQKTVNLKLKAGRGLWLQVASGALQISSSESNAVGKVESGSANQLQLKSGDGAAIQSDSNQELSILIKATEESNFLIFDSVRLA